MSRCETPLPCCDCCTHRLFTPSIEWSADVWRGHCASNTAAVPHSQAVVDAWHHDGVYYLLAEIPVPADIIPAGFYTFHYRVEAWSPEGERQWKSDWLLTMPDTGNRTTRGCIASDGTTVWVAIAGKLASSPSTMFRLDAADGTVLFSGDEGLGQDPQLRVETLQPDAGGVLIGHQTTGVGTAFVSTWADDVVTPVVGPPDDAEASFRTLTATSVQHDVENDVYYVGHTVYGTHTFAGGNDGDCCVAGYLSKFSAGELVWLSGPRTGDADQEVDDPPRPLVRLIGDTLFFALAELGEAFGAVDVEWGVPTWFRKLTKESEDDDGCGLVIADFDADDDFLWLAACRFVVQLDHTGEVVETVAHLTDAASEATSFWVKTVAPDGAGNALGGGVAAKCMIVDNDDRDSEALSCAAFSPGCEGEVHSVCVVPAADPPQQPEYCHVHECGSTSNNGRVALDECTPDQWPPCYGPGTIQWTCGSDVQTRTFNFNSQCLEGGRRWLGEFLGGYVTIDWICGDGPSVEVTLSGCTVTVTSVTYQCDGPFGYAAVYYSFTLDCGDCSGDGCGAMGDEECGDGDVDFCGCASTPSSLTATFTNASCDTGYTGASVTMTWNSGGGYYEYDGLINGKDHQIQLSCVNSATHRVRLNSPTGPECIVTGTPEATATCSPFDVTFTGVTIATVFGGGCGCATGAVDIHITE